MKRLYDTHVYPHLIYAIQIWGTHKASAGYLRPLIVAHKQLIRLIRNVPARAHTKPIMTELDILSVPNLYVLRVCAEMHPYIHTASTKEGQSRPRAVCKPQHIHHYARTTEVHRHSTRQARSGHNHLAPSDNSITQRYIDIWNTLPPKLREIESQKTFKTVLKAYLMEIQNSS